MTRETVTVEPDTERDLRHPLLRKGAVRSTTDFVLPVDKPTGITSHDVVRIVRRVSNQRKVGHAGTLDPMATGLLVVLVGAATRESARITGWTKSYNGVFRLGEETDSYDADTPVSRRTDASRVTRDQIVEAAGRFVGTIRQLTPAYSAVRVRGERSHRRARRGEAFTRPPRIVTIDDLSVREIDGSDVHFSISCSTGTYVRAVAHDIGRALGVGAHLVALRRTRIGSINVDLAWSVEDVNKADLGSELTQE